MQTKTKLMPYQRVQAAYRFLSGFEQGTEQSVCKMFKIKPVELHKAVRDLENNRFKKNKKRWNPLWDGPDCIHHVLDTSITVDIEKGAPKGSDAFVLMDQDFDAQNGVLHLNWDEQDCETLCASLPYRILEILRDSVPDDELYQEALLFTECDFFKAICKKYGLDAEQLIKSALEITKADI